MENKTSFHKFMDATNPVKIELALLDELVNDNMEAGSLLVIQKEIADAVKKLEKSKSINAAGLVKAKKGLESAKALGDEKTIATFGFETAVEFATNCIDRLHSTAEAHERVMIVEVMGRYAGWIALHSGIAGTADCILLPEIPYDIQSVIKKINEREKQGLHFSIIVIAEGALPKDGTISVIGKSNVKLNAWEAQAKNS